MNFITDRERIATITRFTLTHRIVLDYSAYRIDTTRSKARIRAFFVYTCEV